MIDYNEMVREFHYKHGAFYYRTPTIPSDETVILRLRLIDEEKAELMIALHEKKILDVADALGDLLYVVYGTALACGIPIDEVFAEVHRSNMTKPELDAHGKGGKISKEGYRPPRLGPILFPDLPWCPVCGRKLNLKNIFPLVAGTMVCGCGLTKEELI